MRALRRNFSKVFFLRADDTPYVHSIAPGVERITRNTDKQAVIAQPTTPLLVTPAMWSEMAHRSLGEDVKHEEWTEEIWLL